MRITSTVDGDRLTVELVTRADADPDLTADECWSAVSQVLTTSREQLADSAG